MDKGKKFTLGIIIGIITLAAIITPLSIYLTKNLRYIPNNGEIQRTPIVIQSDYDFFQYNFDGDGSKNNPKIIENYHIECTEDYAIEISDTNMYFIIRNCNLKAAISGIYIESILSDTGKVIDNICSNQENGIYAEYAHNLTIKNNICIGNQEAGIEIFACFYSIIADNFCHKNKRGIVIDGRACIGISKGVTVEGNDCQNNYVGISGFVKNIVFANNTISNNQHGLSLIEVFNSTIKDNYISSNNVGFASEDLTDVNVKNNIFFNNSGYSIRLWYVSGLTCINNTFVNRGITFQSIDRIVFETIIISNNTINGKKLGYFFNEQDLAIINPEYGQLILANCSDFEISNQEISNTYYGLRFINCENATVSNNIFQDNQYNIYLSNTNSSTLINNTSIRGEYGVYAQYCSNIDIINNTITESNLHAIIFLGNNSVIFKNTLFGNFNGLIIDYSFNCRVFNNLFLENEGNGLICRFYSELTYIYQNDFIDNIQNQAYDYGINNEWYNSTILEGNYWSDWIGTGPYYIGGTSGSEDLYPLSNPIYP